MLLSVPFSMDVAIILHSLRASGIMGITPVRNNMSALSFMVEPSLVLSSCIVDGYILSSLSSCLVSTALVSVSLSFSVLGGVDLVTVELFTSSGCCVF